MKAMILAAGRGSRLRPLTDHTPKPLLQAGPKRLIEYLIESLVKSGISDLVINHAYLGEQIPATLKDGSQYGASIQYSAEPNGMLETAGGIIKALPLLGNEPFLVVNGDIWTDFAFAKLNDFKFDADKKAHLILVNNPEHNPNGDFAIDETGTLQLEGNQKYTFSGIAVYHPSLFDGLSPEKRPLKPIFDAAINAEAISAELFTGQWSDIGTIERLEALTQQLTKSTR